MKSFTVSLIVPSEFRRLLGTQAQATETIREFTILGLYQDGRISAGKEAGLLGLTRSAFATWLARKGINYFQYDAQEWADEVITVQQWTTDH